jgi:hypothetical protein
MPRNQSKSNVLESSVFSSRAFSAKVHRKTLPRLLKIQADGCHGIIARAAVSEVM